MLARFALCLIAFAFISVAAAQDQPPMKKGGSPPEGMKALKHPDAAVRYRAVETLARLGPLAKFAAPDLRELLKDKNVFVRVKTAEALWKIDKTPSLILMPVLLQAMREKDAAARAAAPPVIALLGSKAKAALPALVRALQDKELNVKLAAVTALGDLGPVAKVTAEDLLDLTTDADFVLLEPFVGAALANLGESSVPVLAKTLANHKSERRRVAAYALGSMGPAAAPAAGDLADTLKSKDPATRRQAAAALGKIGKGASSILPQLQAALDDKDTLVRIETALAVWHISGETKHAATLVKALSDKSPEVRDVACQTLAAMKADAKAAVDPVTKLLDDKELRLRAIITLGEIGPAAKKSLSVVHPLLKDNDSETQLTAAFAVWQITGESTESLAIMEKELGSPTQDKLAIRLLGEMGAAARSVLPTLAEMYRAEDDAGYRQLLACAVKKINPKAALKLGIR